MRKSILFLLTLVLASPAFAKQVHHYVYFELERERITEKSFLNTRALEGAQLKYKWNELEPLKDKYYFADIHKDLATLTTHGKKLFIQIQDLTFNPQWKYVPDYLLTEKEFNGGVAKHYVNEGTAAVHEGWVARRWDKAVAKRFRKLLTALGKEFDGKIVGINLPETAIAFGDRKDLQPEGFTESGYRDEVIETMKSLKSAFPKSVAAQYINFMPGEWLPEEDKGFMKSLYATAIQFGVAVGGPDLLPYKKGQMKHAYHFIPQIKGRVPVAVAIQEGNYEHINPKTGKQVTLAELLDFGTSYLSADYLFWCTQEPFYSRDVVPFLD